MRIVSWVEAAATGFLATLGTLAWATLAGWWRAERSAAHRPDGATAPRVVDDGPADPAEPYQPTPEDWADYRAWADAREEAERAHRQDFCPADYGDYCPDCDREQAEAAAREMDARADGWYLDAVARAGHEGGAL